MCVVVVVVVVVMVVVCVCVVCLCGGGSKPKTRLESNVWQIKPRFIYGCCHRWTSSVAAKAKGRTKERPSASPFTRVRAF